MILISHRGNLDGKIERLENSEEYIFDAFKAGFDVEIDVWYNGNYWLGHDNPIYKTTENFLLTPGLWIHCKNIEALYMLLGKTNCFFHQNDDVTLTSKNYIWTYTGKPLTSKSIAVLPERAQYNFFDCAGICSDYIIKYK